MFHVEHIITRLVGVFFAVSFDAYFSCYSRLLIMFHVERYSVLNRDNFNYRVKGCFSTETVPQPY
jgi:hypothetical protein